MLLQHTAGKGSTFCYNNSTYKSLTRNGFIFTFDFFFFCQNKHRHTVMYLIFSIQIKSSLFLKEIFKIFIITDYVYYNSSQKPPN